jgi:hypothetical protein
MRKSASILNPGDFCAGVCPFSEHLNPVTCSSSLLQLFEAVIKYFNKIFPVLAWNEKIYKYSYF